jgi:hypothetical protein
MGARGECDGRTHPAETAFAIVRLTALRPQLRVLASIVHQGDLSRMCRDELTSVDLRADGSHPDHRRSPNLGQRLERLRPAADGRQPGLTVDRLVHLGASPIDGCHGHADIVRRLSSVSRSLGGRKRWRPSPERTSAGCGTPTRCWRRSFYPPSCPCLTLRGRRGHHGAAITYLRRVGACAELVSLPVARHTH